MSILSEDVVDSRTINERIEELESEREALSDQVDTLCDRLEKLREDCPYDPNPDYLDTANPDFLLLWRIRFVVEDWDAAMQELEEWDEENEEELKLLQEIKEQGESFPDWDDGCALIAEGYFTDYARETAEDIYDIKNHWPYTCIDWEQAAEELKVDYSTIEAGGYTFYICN